MAWELEFDGVNDKITPNTPVVVGTGDFYEKFTFRYSGDDSQILYGNSVNTNDVFRIKTNGDVLIKLGASSTTLNLISAPLSIGVHTIIFKRDSGVLDVTDEAGGSLVVSTAINNSSFTIHGFGFINAGGNRFSGGLQLAQHYDDATGTNLVHSWDATASNHDVGTQPTLLDTVSGNNMVGVGFPTDGSAWVDLGGGITITGATATYSCSSLPAIISVGGTVQITGQAPSYSYGALSGSVDLTPEITITGQATNYSFVANSGVVDLSGALNITGGITDYQYQALAGSVAIQGEILVIGNTPNFSYNTLNASVRGALWSDKPIATTIWTDEIIATTIWTDKG